MTTLLPLVPVPTVAMKPFCEIAAATAEACVEALVDAAW